MLSPKWISDNATRSSKEFPEINLEGLRQNSDA